MWFWKHTLRCPFFSNLAVKDVNGIEFEVICVVCSCYRRLKMLHGVERYDELFNW